MNRKIDTTNNDTDTEGHGRRPPRTDTETDNDTEGHARRIRIIDEKPAADEADTEGHGIKFRP
jgi:hypothetical protein